MSVLSKYLDPLHNNKFIQENKLIQILVYLVLIFLLIVALFQAATWLDDAITGLQGGQVLQGGTFWKALTITFRDHTQPDRRISVTNIRFKNVDRFLPIAVIVHTQGRDSTYFAGTQDAWIEIPNTPVDSLVIRTRNASHSAVIDDLSFEHSDFAYHLNFDHTSDGTEIAANTQLLTYQAHDIRVTFGADNAVPTVIRGGDLAESIGRYISKISGPLSTVLVLALIALPFWMVFRYAQVLSHDLTPSRFFTEQDQSLIHQHGINILWGGRLNGQEYPLSEQTELYQILSSLETEATTDQARLVSRCTEKIYFLFDEIEDRLSEGFGMMGILALSLGLLGTVVGMIDAFKILEDTMKIGEGPAQTQLKMAHYINFALVTTAIGFMGRILSMVLIRKIKAKSLQNRSQMITLVQHFNRTEAQVALPQEQVQ